MSSTPTPTPTVPAASTTPAAPTTAAASSSPATATTIPATTTVPTTATSIPATTTPIPTTAAYPYYPHYAGYAPAGYPTAYQQALTSAYAAPGTPGAYPTPGAPGAYQYGAYQHGYTGYWPYNYAYPTAATAAQIYAQRAGVSTPPAITTTASSATASGSGTSAYSTTGATAATTTPKTTYAPTTSYPSTQFRESSYSATSTGAGASSGTAAGGGTSSGKSTRKQSSTKGLFAKDLKSLMYGFGDDRNPANDTVNVMEEILVEYIMDLCQAASGPGRKNRLSIEDLRRALSLPADAKKLARMEELLFMQEDIKRARAQFNETEVPTSGQSRSLM